MSITRQNHTLNVVFPGTMDDLLDYLRSKGVEMDFVNPGLKGSQSVLEIFPVDFKPNNPFTIISKRDHEHMRERLKHTRK